MDGCAFACVRACVTLREVARGAKECSVVMLHVVWWVGGAFRVGVVPTNDQYIRRAGCLVPSIVVVGG